MQAWNAVKVTNENSEFNGQAGFVIRTEHEGDKALVFVKLDVDGEVHTFDAGELQLL